MIRDKTQHVELLSTPTPFPLRFSPGGFYRVGAKAGCRQCGASINVVVRSPRYLRGHDGEPMLDPRGRKITVAPPDPTSSLTVSTLLLNASEHLCGCYDNPVTDLGYVSTMGRPGRHTRIGKCGLYGHKTCVCGYVWRVHKRGCTTAMIPRDSRMIVTGMSSSLQVRS